MTVFACMAPLSIAHAADPAPAPKSIAPIAPATAPEAAAAKKETPSDRLAPNTIYAEGLGAGLAYSLNYERVVVDNLAVRAGFSYLSFGASAGMGENSVSASASFLMFPITASYLGVRSGKHALELGGGTTLISASGTGSGFGMSASGSGMTALGTAIVGYRIHPIDGAGFNFRVGAMALMGKGLGLSNAKDPEAFGVLPWPYLSLGGSF
jgi:hypothetical protein